MRPRTRKPGRRVRVLAAILAAILDTLPIAVISEDAPATSTPKSSDYSPPKRVGTIRLRELTECSGIAASRKNPDVLWIHNDSGDRPRLFAIDNKGALVAELRVQGATHRDWEDIAIGPGPIRGSDYIYIADTGNNSSDRDDLCLYRFREPALEGLERGKRWRSEPATKISFKYPSNNFDCESIAVHPKSGAVFLITKSLLASSRVYRVLVPTDDSGKRSLRADLGFVTKLKLRSVTGADFSVDGERLALRTYVGIVEYRLEAGRTVREIFKAKAISLPIPIETQGEAIAYRPDGSIVTISEGTRVPIWVLGRKPRSSAASK